MLLALRSLWESVASPPPSQGGGGRGPWRPPRVNPADFFDLSKFFSAPKWARKPLTDLALALYLSGQIDESTFAALLAATE
jgi:hypothetical protein